MGAGPLEEGGQEGRGLRAAGRPPARLLARLALTLLWRRPYRTCPAPGTAEDDKRRYNLGEFKEELMNAMGLNTESEGSAMAFLRRGYKVGGWAGGQGGRQLVVRGGEQPEGSLWGEALGPARVPADNLAVPASPLLLTTHATLARRSPPCALAPCLLAMHTALRAPPMCAAHTPLPSLCADVHMVGG